MVIVLQRKARDMTGEMSHDEVLRQKLALLKAEHRDLDTAITAIENARIPDTLALRRLKKRKLEMRDRIVRIEDKLTPDIIA